MATILIVDDEAGVRASLGAVLRDEEYTVETADSSTRAVVDRYLSSEVVYMGGGFGLDEDQSGDVLQLRRRDWTPWEFERACRVRLDEVRHRVEPDFGQRHAFVLEASPGRRGRSRRTATTCAPARCRAAPVRRRCW